VCSVLERSVACIGDGEICHGRGLSRACRSAFIADDSLIICNQVTYTREYYMDLCFRPCVDNVLTIKGLFSFTSFLG
jgi:hypothetical protein